MLLLTGCTDEDVLQSADPTGIVATGGEGKAVRIVATEEGWQEEQVSVTRAGEALSVLRATSARTWDFTKTSGIDIDALEADATNWTNVESKNEQFTYKNALDNAALQANGHPLTITDGLLFTAAADKIQINKDKNLWLGGTGITLTIPNLKEGQEVTIKYTSSGDDERTFGSYGNLSYVSGFTLQSEKTMHEGKGTVTADGSVTFTTNSALYVYSISVTRAESDGFGLYSDRLKVVNSHVVWDPNILNWAGISNDFYLMLWPNNIIKYSVALNGEAVHSVPDYFTVTGSTYDSKFNGCTYQGIEFTKGFTLGSGASITFHSDANGNKVKVTIVQSTSDEDTKNNQIQFDGVTLNRTGKTTSDGGWMCTVEEITNGRVYTIRNVSPSAPSYPHSIVCADGDPGILYVSVDIPFTAYSPYISDTSLSPTPANGITARSADKVTFKPESDNRIELMWAEDYTSADGTVYLNFKQALGKLSIGTITNNYGETIQLKKITLKGEKITGGDLSLYTGEWSNTTTDSGDIEYNATQLKALFGTLEIPDGGALVFPNYVAYTQIPGSTITFEYEFENPDTDQKLTVSKALTIEQGVNKFINITIHHNHGVELR